MSSRTVRGILKPRGASAKKKPIDESGFELPTVASTKKSARFKSASKTASPRADLGENPLGNVAISPERIEAEAAAAAKKAARAAASLKKPAVKTPAAPTAAPGAVKKPASPSAASTTAAPGSVKKAASPTAASTTAAPGSVKKAASPTAASTAAPGAVKKPASPTPSAVKLPAAPLAAPAPAPARPKTPSPTKGPPPLPAPDFKEQEETAKFKVTAKSDDTVLTLKKQLESEGYKVDSQQMFFRMKRLEDDKTLESYGIDDGKTVNVYISGGIYGGYLKAGKEFKVGIKILKKKDAGAATGPAPPMKKPTKASSSSGGIPQCVQNAYELIDANKRPEDISNCKSSFLQKTLDDYIKSKDDEALCKAIDDQNVFLCTQYVYEIQSYIEQFVVFIARVDNTLDKLIKDQKFLRNASRDAVRQLDSRQSQFFNKYLSETAENIVTMINFHKAWQDRMRPWISLSGKLGGKISPMYDTWPSKVSDAFKGLDYVSDPTKFARLPSELEVQQDPNEYWALLDNSTKEFVKVTAEKYNLLNVTALDKFANIDANSVYFKAALRALALNKKDETLGPLCDPFVSDNSIQYLRVDELQLLIAGLSSIEQETNEVLKPTVDCMAERIKNFNEKYPDSPIDMDALPITDVTVALKNNAKLINVFKRKIGLI